MIKNSHPTLKSLNNCPVLPITQLSSSHTISNSDPNQSPSPKNSKMPKISPSSSSSLSAKALPNIANVSARSSTTVSVINCKVCKISVDYSIKIYSYNSVNLCQSCRKVYYSIWRDILKDNFKVVDS